MTTKVTVNSNPPPIDDRPRIVELPDRQWFRTKDDDGNDVIGVFVRPGEVAPPDYTKWSLTHESFAIIHPGHNSNTGLWCRSLIERRCTPIENVTITAED